MVEVVIPLSLHRRALLLRKGGVEETHSQVVVLWYNACTSSSAPLDEIPDQYHVEAPTGNGSIYVYDDGSRVL